MVRRKERIQPVVAKPLNDTEKRNIVTSFVTNSVNENVTNSVTKNDIENISEVAAGNVTENVTVDDTKIVTNIDTINVTKNITENVASNVTDKITNNVIKTGTRSVTEKVKRDVTITKRIFLGKKEIVANFTSTKLLRPNYNLSEDTIEKIEKISDILGYKKAEFVDIYLNGTLTKILKDLEKMNK